MVVPPAAVAEVGAHFARWDLHSDRGRRDHRRRPSSRCSTTAGGRPTADPAADRRGADLHAAERIARRRAALMPAPAARADRPAAAALLTLLASPNIRSRRPVFQTYDHTVRADTVVGPGCGAGGAADQGHDARRWRSRPTATRATAAPTRAAARPSRWPRRRATWPVVAPSRSPSPTASTSATPRSPRSTGSCRRRSTGWPRRAGRSDVPIVTRQRQPLQRDATASAVKPTPIVGMVGLIEDRSTDRPSGFAGRGRRRRCCSAPVGAELGGTRVPGRIAGLTRLGRRRRSTSTLERAFQRVRARGWRGARLLAAAHDCSPRAGWPSRSPECCLERPASACVGRRPREGGLAAARGRCIVATWARCSFGAGRPCAAARLDACCGESQSARALGRRRRRAPVAWPAELPCRALDASAPVGRRRIVWST